MLTVGSVGPGVASAAVDRRSPTGSPPTSRPGIEKRSATPAAERRGLRAIAAGTSSPATGPSTPPATMPMAGLVASATTTAIAGADDGRDQLAPAGDQADRQPDHGGREDDVDAEPRRVRDLGAEDDARRASPGSTG